jgi:hypothetical protein
MNNITVDGFCYNNNHKKCYFLKEEANGKKFCGLWMRNINGAVNPRKQAFRCTFCNAKKVSIESNGGPAFITKDENIDTRNGSISISNL